MYKIVVEITKETWGKCGIKTVKHYNKKENIIELWQKMSDNEIKLGHSNIANVALELESIVGKKTKCITEEEKEQYKAFLEGEKVIFIIEKLTSHII